MKKHFVAVVSALFFTAFLPHLTAAKNLNGTRPNIVFVMADDMGFGDARCFGKETSKIPTPHIDKLATEGMRFTNALATGSICVPSRAGIMSGHYFFRNQSATWHRRGPWGYLGPVMSKNEFTLGHLMKRAGYRTGYVGKWHLGTEMTTKKADDQRQDDDTVDFEKPLTFGPPEYGFDFSFILPGSLDMYPYAFVKNDRWQGPVTKQKGWSAFHRVGAAADDFEDTKALDTFCTQAAGFLRSQARGTTPFFLYVALTSPHTPLSVSDAFKGKSKLGMYGDFVMETDHCVGRISSALEEQGLDKNTILIVTSDHGPATYTGFELKARQGQMFEYEKTTGHRVSGPWKGYKFTIYEGGFRVPYVVCWPGHVEANTTCDKLIGLQDLMATCADLAGAKLNDNEGVDSISILPLLTNPQANGNRDSFIYQSQSAYAIRKGKWKLILDPGAGCGDQWKIKGGRDEAWRSAIKRHGKANNRQELLHPDFVQLINLDDDPHEDHDLAGQFPDKVKELFQEFETQLANGRCTDGPKVSHLESNFRLLQTAPGYVLAK